MRPGAARAPNASRMTTGMRNGHVMAATSGKAIHRAITTLHTVNNNTISHNYNGKRKRTNIQPVGHRGQAESPPGRHGKDRERLRQRLDNEAWRRTDRQCGGDTHRQHRPQRRPRRWRISPRKDNRDIRPRVVGQNHTGHPRHRRGPEGWRHSRLHRCRARLRPFLRREARS